VTAHDEPTFLVSLRRTFALPLGGLAASGVLFLAIDGGHLVPPELTRLHDVARKLSESLFWLAFTILLIRVGRFVFYEQLLIRLAHVKAPKLLDQAIAAVVVGVGTALMLSYVWGVSISSLVATSGVIGLVVGLALKNVLSDFFSGVALNLEVPFGLNDFVLIRSRGLPMVMGLVREVSWRSTTVMTPERKIVTLPNTLVAESVVENGSQPAADTEFELEIVLDWSVPAPSLQALLEAAALEAHLAGAMVEPAKVRLARLVGGGVVYKLKYLVDPLAISKGKARHALLEHAHKHLRCAGLRPVHELPPSTTPPQRIVDHHAPDERRSLLHEAAVLGALTRDERERIAEAIHVREVHAGAPLVEQGHEGSSMFVVAAGVLEVTIDGARVAVGGPGHVFGEMSLLTGEPRSATVTALVPSVVYEVPKDALAPLLATRPALAEELSEVVARRRKPRPACADHAPHEAEVAGFRKMLASAMREFFRA
jgi:small-conductance mechanosensitive channel